MATKQITTWAEFKTALTENITENTTYEIMNDIDASDTVVSSEITCANSNHYKIFQPASGAESVKINGITSYLAPLGVGGIIRMYQYTKLRFNNVHFPNLMLSSTYLFTGSSYNTCILQLNNCLVNGVIKCLCYRNGAAFTFTNCSVNLKCNALSNQITTFNNCWIHIEPLSETNEIITNPNITVNIGSNNYFEGVLKRTSGNIGSYSALLPALALNCVFNFDIILTNNPGGITISIADHNGQTSTIENSSLVNLSKIKNANGTTPTVTASTTGFPYLLTNEQMKSKTYIQGNTHFPLQG